jgi:hypothetical protein
MKMRAESIEVHSLIGRVFHVNFASAIGKYYLADRNLITVVSDCGFTLAHNCNKVLLGPSSYK